MANKQTTSQFSNRMSGLLRRLNRIDAKLMKELEDALNENYGSILNSADVQNKIDQAGDIAQAKSTLQVLREESK